MSSQPNLQAMEATARENYKGVWDQRIGFGKRPAVLVVDFLRAYTEKASPLFASGVQPAVDETRRLLAAARSAGVPVIHTTASYQPSSLINGGVWIKKAPVLQCLLDPRFSMVCEGVEPLSTELVVTKQYASAFFGTSLAATLTAAGIDTLIVTGCSTSGCIRATAVDGVQNGFRVIVPRECVGDRHQGPHDANLFDIDSKYGDVVGKDEVLTYLSGISVALAD